MQVFFCKKGSKQNLFKTEMALLRSRKTTNIDHIGWSSTKSGKFKTMIRIFAANPISTFFICNFVFNYQKLLVLFLLFLGFVFDQKQLLFLPEKRNRELTSTFPRSFWYMGTPFEPYLDHYGINGLQKGQNMVLNGKFSQPYSQYPVHARVYVRKRLFFVYFRENNFWLLYS